MNSQSPIYSLKFTISWILVYGFIVFILWQFINIFIALYIGLWLLNLLIEIVEKLGYNFSIKVPDIDEENINQLNPIDYVIDVSMRKGLKIYH